MSKFTANSLYQKIDWEGGIGGAVDYGIKPEDILDKDIAAAWGKVCVAVKDFNDLMEDKVDWEEVEA